MNRIVPKSLQLSPFFECNPDHPVNPFENYRINLSLDVVSKHLAIWRQARIVIQGRNRLYQIAPQFVADKENRLLDFGWCLLRLNVGGQR